FAKRVLGFNCHGASQYRACHAFDAADAGAGKPTEKDQSADCHAKSSLIGAAAQGSGSDGWFLLSPVLRRHNGNGSGYPASKFTPLAGRLAKIAPNANVASKLSWRPTPRSLMRRRASRDTAMAHQFILTESGDGVAVITLNRPEKLNALSFGLVRELDEALTEYENDEAIKAVILTGAGERAFSAGADIHEMAGLSSEELAQR